MQKPPEETGILTLKEIDAVSLDEASLDNATVGGPCRSSNFPVTWMQNPYQERFCRCGLLLN